jgi:malonyl-CoA/methylmalonyl-CoA synthetase
MRTADRNALVPSQRGRNVLPNSPFYSQLLRLAYDTPSKTIIRDVNLGQEKSRIQLLTDVLELQDHLRHELDESVNRALERGESVFIAILAPGGYESAVAVLGALALGMAVVPISECFGQYFGHLL